MKGLNSNRIAGVITALLICAGFLTGGTRPLNKLRTESTNVFFTGTEQSGPNRFNLVTDLADYAGLAANAVLMAEKNVLGNSTSVEELKQARERLLAELSATTEKHIQADELGRLAANVKNAVEDVNTMITLNSNMNTEDIRRFSGNYKDMDSLYTIISRQANIFNGEADKFNKALGRFPAVFFKLTGLCKPAPLFNFEGGE